MGKEMEMEMGEGDGRRGEEEGGKELGKEVGIADCTRGGCNLMKLPSKVDERG